MLTICTWLWGNKYNTTYVDKLHSALIRNMKLAFKFRIFTPCEEDMPLTEIPGCFARLRMFDPQWQQREGFVEGDRIVCLDLDIVITRPIGSLFIRSEPFVILQNANMSNPCPFNGSVMMLSCGAHPEVWSDFSLVAANRAPYYEFPDDQGWLHHKLPRAAGWRCGPLSGIYAYHKRNWPRGDRLPADAKMVAFFGHRDPAQFQHLPWVARHWQ